MLFEHFFMHKIKYIRYGNEENGFVFALTGEDAHSFTLKIIKKGNIQLVLLKRTGINDYSVIIKDNVDSYLSDEQLLKFLSKEITYYIMNQSPIKLITE